MYYEQRIDDALICIQSSVADRVVSTVIILNHNQTPKEFGDSLTKAAAWFYGIPRGTVKPVERKKRSKL